MATSSGHRSPGISQASSGIEAKPFHPYSSDDSESTAVPTGRPMQRSKLHSEVENDKGLNDETPVEPQTEDVIDLRAWIKDALREHAGDGSIQRHTGFTFSDLNVAGFDSTVRLQSTVASTFTKPFQKLASISKSKRESGTQILYDCHGFLKEGEMLFVLGRPGSGCSTLLKAIAGKHRGLTIGGNSIIEYNGISSQKMHKQFRGEVLYNEEMDHHFPHLTVSQTLSFAAEARAPQNLPNYNSTKDYVAQLVDAALRVFKLKQAANTKVGDDFVRGVSGGERKRTSIAEMALSRAPLSLWDNSTRGLDAASALDFASSLRIGADITSTSSVVTIYQASEAIFALFNRITVLYKGRQIYFGPRDRAKPYFEEMGYACPERMTTGDFLTSVTNPSERQARPGFEATVPRTPEEFGSYWKESQDFKALREEIEAIRNNDRTTNASQFLDSRRAEQGRGVRKESPYTLSLAKQVSLCTKRAYQRLWNDFSSTVSTVFGTVTMALIMGSIFYGTPQDTDALFSKGGILYFAILINALNAVSEINTLYAHRPIIAKQASYAMCHPAAEAMAGVVADIPIKFATAVCFNIILYFLGSLRIAPGPFFIFFLFGFIINVAMSFAFRTLGALTKSVSQAMTGAGLLVLAIVIYTGYAIPRPDMRPWLQWMSWINPVAYVFESLLVNELHGREFDCSSFVPGYRGGPGTFTCSGRGAVAGEDTVSGDAFLNASYDFSYSHLWRNFGILCAFLLFFLVAYLLASEYGPSTGSSADVLIFRKAALDNSKTPSHDEESQSRDIPKAQLEEHHAKEASYTPAEHSVSSKVFSWKGLNYDIKVADGTRRLLDQVDGWVKPGALTALMGASGAGKTTLLNVLAQRVPTGVVTGEVRVDGRALNESFQRTTGYVQQQDLHLESTTVREALQFSALLRQPKSIPTAEKLSYVNEVIVLLDMTEFADAVVGIPGLGLNVEQRKLLSIGVELAAKPEFLLFLDEPTSGLDSQSAWAIVKVLRRLANHGTAILCTIHQPSSVLFQEFDRLLLLAKGGKTVYFGDIGSNSATLINYFTSHRGASCDPEANPAEWMLQVLNAQNHDWHQAWLQSTERESVHEELQSLQAKLAVVKVSSPEASSEFAMPLMQQIQQTTIRVFQQYWRTPEYIWAKLLLGTLAALFIGFSFFKSNSSQQGLQNIMFSVFMLTSIFTTLVQQIMPRFVTQRSLYEVRERPSKVYSWKAFIFANVLVEIPWQTLLSVLVFVSYYYPLGYWQHSDPQANESERAGLMFFYILSFFIFASTFAQMVVAPLPNEGTGGALATVLFALTLIFNGVIQPASSLPGFWIFMYRVSPQTYLISGMLATGLHNRPVVCASKELSVFSPPSGQTCGEYLAAYLQGGAPGRLLDPNATSRCEYCPFSSSNQFLAGIGASWGDRWRNLGLMWVYIAFNVTMTFVLYYLVRVRQGPIIDLGKIKKLFMKQKAEEEGGEKEHDQAEEDEKLRLRRSYSRKIEIQPRAY